MNKKVNALKFEHIPVLFNETIENLNVKPGGIYIDGTLGGAGHSYEIAKRMQPGGTLIGIDQDTNALAAAQVRLQEFKDSVIYVHSNFQYMKSIANEKGFEYVDGILLDIGVSSHQLDEDDRGFSYMKDGPLDMRMNRESKISAEYILNNSSEKELTRIISEYGEENWALRIAKFICEARKTANISTTGQLVDIIKKAIPKAARSDGSHPAKRTFQAIRIAVNDELNVLQQALKDAVDILRPGGRIAVITFHSLEDRIVKSFFNEMEKPCKCPPKMPMCVCGKESQLKILTKKPITATEEELLNNSRSKSAKLRVAERINSKKL